MKKFIVIIYLLFTSIVLYGQNEDKETDLRQMQYYLHQVFEKTAEAFRFILVNSGSTDSSNITFTNPFKPYTSLDTVLAITSTPATLATLLGYNWNLRGGLLEIWNYDSGQIIAHGSSGIGFSSNESGGILYFSEYYSDIYGFYKDAAQCYVVSDQANGYVRIRLIGR